MESRVSPDDSSSISLCEPSRSRRNGEIRFRTNANAVVDVAQAPRLALKPLRKEMQLIFQDPFSSLNPRMTLFDMSAATAREIALPGIELPETA